MEIKVNRKGEKGSSLVEILVAMAILSFLMIGILQMFSAAYLINIRSSARTFAAYKCEQVAEIIRLNWQLQQGGAMLPDNGILIQDQHEFQLPYSPSDVFWNYWGPQGANVMETEGGSCRIFVRIVQPVGTNFFEVHVASISDDQWRRKGEPSTLWGTNKLFLGRVEYVQRLQ